MKQFNLYDEVSKLIDFLEATKSNAFIVTLSLNVSQEEIEKIKETFVKNMSSSKSVFHIKDNPISEIKQIVNVPIELLINELHVVKTKLKLFSFSPKDKKTGFEFAPDQEMVYFELYKYISLLLFNWYDSSDMEEFLRSYVLINRFINQEEQRMTSQQGFNEQQGDKTGN